MDSLILTFTKNKQLEVSVDFVWQSHIKEISFF